ncbi:MAG: hypothetical protein Q9165_006487 [Trypethelium subeluteriae]
MFPVYVFLAFIGINAFERGLMKYHDRRIAREREQMARERKTRQHASSPYSESSDNDFSESESDIDSFAKEHVPRHSLRPTHLPRRHRQRVHFEPAERRERARDERVYPPSDLMSQNDHTSDNGNWNGTHWDDFIEDWCGGDPTADPFGVLPPVKKRNSLSYGQVPHIETSRAKASRPERRTALV